MTQTSINPITPVNRDELVRLSEKGKSNPGAVRTLKVKTVLESKFRHLNYIRNLPPHVIDEPPGLLGDDTAPNPSEAVLAALGSCLSGGLLANAVYRNIRWTKGELELAGDISITAVWGPGDTSEDRVGGGSAVRATVHLEGDAPRAELDALVRQADRWSPVANTVRLPVSVTVEPA
jgi:organic hydroperoxide reductase OsmC/OhrA